LTIIRSGANVEPTDKFSLFEMAESRSMSVGSMLVGTPIPLYNTELVLYNTYKIVRARLEQQSSKGS
jgi:hypothetical protein